MGGMGTFRESAVTPEDTTLVGSEGGVIVPALSANGIWVVISTKTALTIYRGMMGQHALDVDMTLDFSGTARHGF